MPYAFFVPSTSVFPEFRRWWRGLIPVHFMSPLPLHTVEIYSADFLFLFPPKSKNLKQWQQVKDHIVRNSKLRPNCSFKNKGFIWKKTALQLNYFSDRFFASTCPHLHTRIPPPYTARDTSSCHFLKVKDTVNNAQKNVSGVQYTTPGSFTTGFKVRTYLS